MLNLLWILPAAPLAGFVLLGIVGRRLPRALSAWVGVGSVGIAAASALAIAIAFVLNPPVGASFRQTLWQWFAVGPLRVDIALRLDSLSLVMMLVVTGVGFLIHLYSTEFMRHDPGFSRFFAYMNLFVGSMLLLVLADNLVLLYLGWEGVGLCSYLLIGFWYADPKNGRAARKAFIVTRVGDAAMAVGLFLLFSELKTLRIDVLMHRADVLWQPTAGHPHAMAIVAAALLLGGAVGKSAQLPLQTWLPDAMAGPTPVSALIHAATMVTAGVYLIARTHMLFELAPPVMAAVAVVGALTLLLAGFSALTQVDIKRVLAYSTISQIGYMFVALGVGAWSAAIFHLMTHAFFKALLFLGAGAIINHLHHEHDITKMGGLRHSMPLTFWTFLIAGASLAGFPLVTAGFYSKDLILWRAWSVPGAAGVWLWAAGLAGALLTALYTFRLIFLTFYGKQQMQPTGRPGWRMGLPLVTLASLSVVGGAVELPRTLGNLPLFSDLLQWTLPAPGPEGPLVVEGALQLIAAAVVLGGIFVAYVLFIRWRFSWARPTGLQRFWRDDWDFDRLYDTLLVRPFVGLARLDKSDVVDWFYRGLAGVVRWSYVGLDATQNGRLRWYATGIAFGAVLVLAMAVLL